MRKRLAKIGVDTAENKSLKSLDAHVFRFFNRLLSVQPADFLAARQSLGPPRWATSRTHSDSTSSWLSLPLRTLGNIRNL